MGLCCGLGLPRCNAAGCGRSRSWQTTLCSTSWLCSTSFRLRAGPQLSFSGRLLCVTSPRGSAAVLLSLSLCLILRSPSPLVACPARGRPPWAAVEAAVVHSLLWWLALCSACRGGCRPLALAGQTAGCRPLLVNRQLAGHTVALQHLHQRQRAGWTLPALVTAPNRTQCVSLCKGAIMPVSFNLLDATCLYDCSCTSKSKPSHNSWLSGETAACDAKPQQAQTDGGGPGCPACLHCTWTHLECEDHEARVLLHLQHSW